MPQKCWDKIFIMISARRRNIPIPDQTTQTERSGRVRNTQRVFRRQTSILPSLVNSNRPQTAFSTTPEVARKENTHAEHVDHIMKGYRRILEKDEICYRLIALHPRKITELHRIKDNGTLETILANRNELRKQAYENGEDTSKIMKTRQLPPDVPQKPSARVFYWG